jgi:hypothetical protein
MKRNLLWIGAFLLGFMIIPSYSQFGFRHTNIEIRDLIRKNKLGIRNLLKNLEKRLNGWIPGISA